MIVYQQTSHIFEAGSISHIKLHLHFLSLPNVNCCNMNPVHRFRLKMSDGRLEPISAATRSTD
jgi:hypothetical protein